MKGRTFFDLRNEKNRRSLRKFIKEVAYAYAYVFGVSTRHEILLSYNITERCYYTILEKAVVWNIVDDATVYKMEEKALKNSKPYTKSSKRTKEKYARLREKRKEYIEFPFSKAEAISIVVQFTEDRYVTKKVLADIYCVTPRDIDKALYVASANCWIDDALFKKLKEQSLEGVSEEKSIQFFKDLEKLRENMKKPQQKENK